MKSHSHGPKPENRKKAVIFINPKMKTPAMNNIDQRKPEPVFDLVFIVVLLVCCMVLATYLIYRW